MPRLPSSSYHPLTDLDSDEPTTLNTDNNMSYEEPSDVDDLDVLDDDNLSVDDPLEKQRAALQIYLDSVPYECESLDQMQTKLEKIVEKIIICAQSKSWLTITHWDGLLQCWLTMRYPMPKTIRAKLVRLYYELCLVPGIEARVTREWADMVSRLICNTPGLKRKLEVQDLQLPWQPLWRSLKRELWPKTRIQVSSRNVVNILLYVAEQCQRYFPASEIPDMLSIFLPLLTKSTVLVMVPVITSFMPPTHTHLYLPALFKLWEAFNSTALDDRLLELAADLAGEHVAGKAGSAGEAGAEWKDVGIWTEAEWTMLMTKGLAAMNVPIGPSGGASTTAAYADAMANKNSRRIKKTISKQAAIARLLVYSMAVDGPVRQDAVPTPRSKDGKEGRFESQQMGFIAGSKALDSLDRLITSTESFFHPSNHGKWTVNLTNFLQLLVSKFSQRWGEEQEPNCKTPSTCKLTPAIRRDFVKILRTPALLVMFSKDHVTMTYAQSALRNMALLEPGLIMPELLERAYGGLEVVNETHRTTAVLSILSAVALPLVSEKIWLGGQKHVVPLLELCLPGIDLNDPSKTARATAFIVAAVQHIKIGDISMHQSGFSLSGDVPGEDVMDTGDYEIPEGVEEHYYTYSRSEERTLARDSTASFADWVTSLFRRVLALYENLPEEGGSKGTTGGKQEEAVLKCIKSMMDIVCLHLSDELFDLVLRLVYDYATANAKSNAVRALGQLIACLARVKPEQTITKFLPFCILQIKEELKHGASSTRTTSTHVAIPSDTTLHWNIAILRGCLGFGGSAVLKYKDQIFGLVTLLIDGTKTERGYTGAGRLITRLLHTVASVYPIDNRFVNTIEWENPDFDRDHNAYWGRMYQAQDVEIDWHVPGSEEIAFVLEFLDRIAGNALDKVETLLTQSKWDNVARNDFCRYLHACKAIWSGLSTFCQESDKEFPNPCLEDEYEIAELVVTPLVMKAGFTLTDPHDPRYQTVLKHRTRYAKVIHQAAIVLRQGTDGEDHIDAVLTVTRAIETLMLEYGMSRGSYEALQKNYKDAREQHRSWTGQKENSRLVFVKRANAYHSGRLYMHAVYRRRSALDDQLLEQLLELSLSPYTRVRKLSQAVLQNVYEYYVRSTRITLNVLLDSLVKGTDPDRMKGALNILGDKGTAAYALADQKFHGLYLLALLECQHEEKPSIQKLVADMSSDCLAQLKEEVSHTDAFSEETPGVQQALLALEAEIPRAINQDLLARSRRAAAVRVAKRNERYDQTVSSIISIASAPTTHWRYVQMATRFLQGLLRRDRVASPAMATFFAEHSISPQPTIRTYAQRGLVRLISFIKIRTYAKSVDELWRDEWHNPLERQLSVTADITRDLKRPFGDIYSGSYVDKVPTGFLAWTATLKSYAPVTDDETPFTWERDSIPCLDAVRNVLGTEFYSKLAVLWGQESNKNPGTIDLRADNLAFMKTLAKMFGGEKLDELLGVLEPLLLDQDRFRQRAAAEMLAGILRGSKHWPKSLSDKLWTWTTSKLNRIFAQIKPDTLGFWENLISGQLENWDPRRNEPLVRWILSLPLDFQGDSAFTMSKSLSIFGLLVCQLGTRVESLSDKYVSLLLDNANTGYAEIRGHISQHLFLIISSRWQPTYSSTEAFLAACQTSKDPLHIQDAIYIDRVQAILVQLPKWREERLPPPRVSQSQYDKVGLSLIQWMWLASHGPQAPLMFSYLIPMLPDIFKMSELSDNSTLQAYSSAVLYVLSAVNPGPDRVDLILQEFITAITSSDSWRIRLACLPALVVFFYRNLIAISPIGVSKVMDVLLDCLADENVEVREMASKTLSGVVRCSQRQSIVPLKNRFVALARKVKLPARSQPNYAESLRSLHSAILGLCALVDCFPYSVEPWMPSLTEVLAPHSTDPPPISTTIRKCASEFKKTHQDTWHKDQLAFNEEQLQCLSTMLVGTSYYA